LAQLVPELAVHDLHMLALILPSMAGGRMRDVSADLVMLTRWVILEYE
jgi:hypothetical protein